MRRYLVLALAAVAAGGVLALAGRLPREAAKAPPPGPAAPAAAVALAIEGSGMVPHRSEVPSGSRVTLTLENRRKRVAVVSLAGYDDRLAIGALAPGGRWRGQFVADRPGEAFAWLVDGSPAGVLAVMGSHLVEGHR